MRENKKFRNHISIVIEQIGGGILAIVVVLFTIILQNADEMSKLSAADLSLFTGRTGTIFLGILALFLFTVGNRIFVWSQTYIHIEENAIIVERGRISKKKNTIGIGNISNINIEQNLFEMLLKTCKVKLDTNSRSTADSTDVTLVLKKEDALWFKQEVTNRMEELSGEFQEDKSGQIWMDGMAPGPQEKAFDIIADFGEILQHGIFSINILSLLILIGAVVGSVAAAVRLFEQPDMVRSIVGSAAAVIFSIMIVASALWDTVKDFIRYYGFRARREGNKIYIGYGLFRKVEYTVPADKVQALRIRQTFIARIFHRYTAELVNVGMGDEQKETNSFFLPYMTEEKMKQNLERILPEYTGAAEQKIVRPPVSAWAVWSVSLIIWILGICAAAALGSALGNRYALPIWGCTAGAILFTLLMAVLYYITAGAGAGEKFLKLSTGFFRRDVISVRYSNIQYVTIRQNVIARACGIRRGKIHLLASSAGAVHNIPYFAGNTAEKIKERMLLRRSR